MSSDLQPDDELAFTERLGPCRLSWLVGISALYFAKWPLLYFLMFLAKRNEQIPQCSLKKCVVYLNER